MRKLIKQIIHAFSAAKTFPYVSEGLRSRNNRTRIECVDLVGFLIDNHGAEIVGQLKSLQLVASLTAEQDGEIRKAALNTLATGFSCVISESFKNTRFGAWTMGNSEETKPSKPDQANNIHVYPDWAAMQAFYGTRVAVPPYFNSAVASGHAPHPYMWGPPQHMMPPYGPPYAAIYAHGGVYAHPGVTLVNQGLVKKLKEFDGLAMSLGNGNAAGLEEADSREVGQNGRKRSREEIPSIVDDGFFGSWRGVDAP
ncbi:Common plant regulatory factor 1 [Camellia lanceoleosa]|uniref:Common plant regulatory factor 1 n=1 Tax=Camellia lanceoleosa TaxID=1840588 RepID=A0ACC0J5Y2_9ERIC|nr:Common plant regulatory factor 1 [Camellia lanceoleosa]